MRYSPEKWLIMSEDYRGRFEGFLTKTSIGKRLYFDTTMQDGRVLLFATEAKAKAYIKKERPTESGLFTIQGRDAQAHYRIAFASVPPSYRENPARPNKALEVATAMRHDVEIFYSKHRDRGNMYYYAFNHALATRDERKMLTALKAMEVDMDIFYGRHREPGNPYYAAFKAVIGKRVEKSNPGRGLTKSVVNEEGMGYSFETDDRNGKRVISRRIYPTKQEAKDAMLRYRQTFADSLVLILKSETRKNPAPSQVPKFKIGDRVRGLNRIDKKVVRGVVVDVEKWGPPGKNFIACRIKTPEGEWHWWSEKNLHRDRK